MRRCFRNENFVGRVFNSKNFGKFTIIKCESSDKVKIQFENTGGVNTATLYHIKRGSVADLLAKTTYGVGYLGYGYNRKCEDSRNLLKIWSGVLQRSFDPSWKNRHECYRDTSCSEEFLCASDFIRWAKTQVGFNSVDEFGKKFAIDKDLLGSGCNSYSPETCVFVPREINNLLLSTRKERGSLPIGVTLKDGKFRSRVSVNNREVALGVFDTSEEAFQAYKKAKEAYIKEVAGKWRGRVDNRVYEALLNYEIEITD